MVTTYKDYIGFSNEYLNRCSLNVHECLRLFKNMYILHLTNFIDDKIDSNPCKVMQINKRFNLSSETFKLLKLISAANNGIR